jgi:putative protein kinase ArgK-like GTPase of G3E family
LLATVATRNEGVEPLADALTAHAEHLRASGGFALRRGERGHRVFVVELAQACAQRLLAAEQLEPVIHSVVEDVRLGRLDPYTAVATLMNKLAWPGSDTR